MSADDGGGLTPSRDDVLLWLQSMSRHSAFGLSRLFRLHSCPVGRSARNMETLLRTLKLCSHLRGDGALHQALADAGTLIGLPAGWITSESIVIPSRHILSRRRFHADAGLCLLARAFFSDILDPTGECAAGMTMFLLSDSSPRVGREWLLTELYVIADASLDAFWLCVEEIQAIISSHDPSVSDTRTLDALLAPCEQRMAKLLRRLSLIPAGMAVGVTNLAVKFCALMYQLRISFCDDNFKLSSLLKSILSVTTDLGTESGLAHVQLFPCEAVFPWLCNQLADEDTVVTAGILPVEQPLLSLQNSAPVPVVEHITDNALKRVRSVLEHHKGWEASVHAVAKLLNSKL